MTRFRFRLESALRWRQAQLEAEERRLEAALADAGQGAARLAEIRGEQARASRGLMARASLTGAELMAHSGWMAALGRRDRAAAAELARAEGAVGERRAAVLEARRRVRLLERLRERRAEEWNYEFQRRLEEFAGDSHRSRFALPPPSPDK